MPNGMERLHTMEINEIAFVATIGKSSPLGLVSKYGKAGMPKFFKILSGEASTLSGVRYEYSGGRKNNFFLGSTWSEDFSITGIGCRYDPGKSILKQGQGQYSTLQSLDCHRSTP